MKSQASAKAEPLCVIAPPRATASQTDADGVVSPERYKDLLRTLTMRSAVLAAKNAKLREDRDRLQARGFDSILPQAYLQPYPHPVQIHYRNPTKVAAG